MDIKKESVLLTVKDVVKFAQVGRSFVYQEVAAGRFPKPVKLGRSVRWLKSEVLAWVDGKALNREAATEGKEMLGEAHESEINDCGPAFPGYGETGMTLRDYFAAKAMQATMTRLSPNPAGMELAAALSYEMADQMMKAREAK